MHREIRVVATFPVQHAAEGRSVSIYWSTHEVVFTHTGPAVRACEHAAAAWHIETKCCRRAGVTRARSSHLLREC
jgi:hypothetical protein